MRGWSAGHYRHGTSGIQEDASASRVCAPKSEWGCTDNSAEYHTLDPLFWERKKERWNKGHTVVVSLEVWALRNAYWNIWNGNPRWKTWSNGSFSVPNNTHWQILAVSPRMSLMSQLVQNEMEQGKKWQKIMLFAGGFQSRNLAVWQGAVWRHFNMRRNMMCLSVSSSFIFKNLVWNDNSLSLLYFLKCLNWLFL